MAIPQIPGYEILSEIGVGGMSRVYLAYDPPRQRQVAIKLLPSEYLNDLGFRARFEQEARLIAGLKHEAIVPVYEQDVVQGQPFFVMRYMQQGSLAERLAHGPIDADQASQVVARISSALAYAHHLGIIHRDLKPSNILFDQDDNAFLADFGIALRTASAWQRDLASGTPTYMSPEQALKAGSIDARSDVYSLGIIAFLMLTGRLPSTAEAPTDVPLIRIHEPPPTPGATESGLPPALEAVLCRALAQDRGDRYASAEEFAAAFLGALHLIEGKSSSDEIQQSDSRVQEPAFPLSTAPQPIAAERQIRPPFAEFARPFNFPSDGKSRSRPKRYEGYRFYALGLAIWLAVLLAAFAAVLARAEVLFPSSNIRMIYRGPSIAVLNPSFSPVNLSGVVFQRLSDDGTITASFSAEQWGQVNSEAVKRLAAGDCLQLVRSRSSKIELTPGKTPAKPPSCDVSQGWLVAPDKRSLFWTLEGDGARFRVLLDDQVIHECRITAGTCDFYLPQSEYSGKVTQFYP